MASADLLNATPAAPRKDPAPRRWSEDEFRCILDLGIFAGRAVLLAEGQLLERPAARGEPRPVVFTQTEFGRLWDANFFRGQRVQLIGGEIVEESPMKPAHATSIRKATRVLERLFPTGHDVRTQLPLDFTPVSRPYPDVAVVVGAVEDFADRHPTAAVLVEVADTTLEEDTHDKANLYAAAGVPDYWVIDVTGRVLVFRDPRPAAGEPFGHTYGRVTAHGRDEVVTPLARPEARVPVNDLLP